MTALAVTNQPEFQELHGMMSYHLGWGGDSAGVETRGKRIRPLLVLLTCAAAGMDWEIALPAAAAVELIHNFSLIHDDIEDQDEYRYGQPTLHRRYGVASALNVGDYLIGMGYRLVSRDATTLGPETAADVLDILAEAHQRLCEGQGAELYWRDALDKQLQPEDALQIYALKTSPAFEAGGVPEVPLLRLLRVLAERLSFQGDTLFRGTLFDLYLPPGMKGKRLPRQPRQ